MHFTKAMYAALLALVPLISAHTMQYGDMTTPDGVSQKIGWISDTNVCTAVVPVLAEGGQNACDVPFDFPDRAPGYTFYFKNCDGNGTPQALQYTANGGPDDQVQGNGYSEGLSCKNGQFTQGTLGNQFSLPF
jgi:hypothetical protein